MMSWVNSSFPIAEIDAETQDNKRRKEVIDDTIKGPIFKVDIDALMEEQKHLDLKVPQFIHRAITYLHQTCKNFHFRNFSGISLT